MKKLDEGFGAISMEPDPAERIMDPDTTRSNALMFHSGSSGTIPAHWNNSPFLTGGRLTSAFGANPKMEKKIKIMSYQEFIGQSKKVNK
jgi:hypothetical protein